MVRWFLAFSGSIAITAQAAATPILEVGDNLSGYVQGRHAVAAGDLDRAADFFASALARTPDDPDLLRQTFELAIAAGDEKRAVDVARKLAVQDRFDSAASLLIVADAVKRRDWRMADNAIAHLKETGFGSFVVPILDAWMLDARGKTTQALERLASGELDGFAKSYVDEHRAHLLMRARRYQEAASLYETQIKGDEGGNVRLRIAAAAARQAAGDNVGAMRILETKASHPDLAAARAALAAGRKIAGPPANAREGIALMALRMSADLGRERPVPVSLTLARIATFLAPGDATAWMMTGELLSRNEKYENALTAVRSVAEDDPVAPLARGQEAAILSELDRPDDAVALLKAATARAGATGDDWARLGDLLQQTAKFDEAADAYARAIALGASEQAVQWRLHFLRGTALEQGGRWPEAERELRAAVTLQPDDASLLNYLGYSLLDRNVSRAEARTLIERAHKLAPADSYITDSLGWAQYQAGEYAAAVTTLEQAIAGVPDDATIGEHLGDAYWRVGRWIEARHRWTAALVADPKPEQKARLQRKRDFGLDIVLAEAARGQMPRP
jgi:tetratricopeptide (TPR) repeat protein